jgi:hypothetical protein
VALVPFAVKVAVPAPGTENGVAPESVKVPACAPVAKVTVAVAVLSAFKIAVPPTLTEPESREKVALLTILPLGRWLRAVKLPEIDKAEIVEVRVLAMVEAAVGAVVPPTETEAQLMVPAPAIVADVAMVALFCSVIPALIARTTPALTVKVEALTLALLKVTELIVAFAVTITESPARMITSSAGPGTVPPGQGALAVVEFQLPLPAVVIVAAKPVDPQSKADRQTKNGRAFDDFERTGLPEDGERAGFKICSIAWFLILNPHP